jgi:hypothetical protein
MLILFAFDFFDDGMLVVFSDILCLRTSAPKSHLTQFLAGFGFLSSQLTCIWGAFKDRIHIDHKVKAFLGGNKEISKGNNPICEH